MAKKNETTTVIGIRPIDIKKVRIRIVGDSPLVMHAWSEKAKRMMLETQMGVNKTKKKEPKNPVDDFIRSMYWLTEMPEDGTEEAFAEAVKDGARFGIPVTGIKQGALSAAYRLGWVKDRMGLKGAFFIDADENGLVEVHADTPIMREDLVRVGMGTADLRYRGEFRNWRCDLTISYNAAGQFSLEDIINAINAGGYVCGLGEWRPEKDGDFGRYHVEAI